MPNSPATYLILTALLGACAPNVQDGRADGSIAIPDGIHAVHVTLEKGSVSVEPATGSGIEWEAATRKGTTSSGDLGLLEPIAMELRAETKDGVLDIRGPKVPAELAERDPGAALVMKLAMKVPPNVDLVVRSGRGPLGVRDWKGEVDLHTDAGEIRLERCTGDVKTFTGAGHHTVIAHRGGADLSTPHGDFLVYLDEIGASGVSIHTKAGSLQCNVPVGASFELDAETAVGEVEMRYPLEKEKVGKRGMKVVGTVRDGGPELKLRADRGSVSVREAQREDPR